MINKISWHKDLYRWYAEHGRRDLPWRNTADPYHIWVSEIMLQQTQVKTVLERFYGPFLQQFPTMEILAAAREEEVLKIWQGLGYYTRARNLHKAAQQALTPLPRLRGRVGEGVGSSTEKADYSVLSDGHPLLASPASEGGVLAALQALPGIGKNTAHAIAAFAFHQPVPVMEANVKRVLARVFALKNPTEKLLWEKAESLLDHTNPFDYNQAMMDVGALICTPKAPRCGACPLNSMCAGKSHPQNYPQKLKKKTVPVRKRVIVVFCCHPEPKAKDPKILRSAQNDKRLYYIAPRTSRFLSGLYGFPEFEQAIRFNNKTYATKSLKHLGGLTQKYSHFTLEAEIYLKEVKAGGKGWLRLQDIEKLPLSRADSKVLALLVEKQVGKN